MQITATQAILRMSGSYTSYAMYTKDDVELFTVDATDSYMRRVMRALWYMRGDTEYVPCVMIKESDGILRVMYDGSTIIVNTATGDAETVITLSDKVRGELNAN